MASAFHLPFSSISDDVHHSRGILNIKSSKLKVVLKFNAHNKPVWKSTESEYFWSAKVSSMNHKGLEQFLKVLKEHLRSVLDAADDEFLQHQLQSLEMKEQAFEILEREVVGSSSMSRDECINGIMALGYCEEKAALAYQMCPEKTNMNFILNWIIENDSKLDDELRRTTVISLDDIGIAGIFRRKTQEIENQGR